MINWFRRPKQKPRDTREMIRVLRAAAQFSDDTAQRIEYNQAADALDRVISAAARHSDAPTRDAFSYALGRAELDLGDKLTELIEVTKETHIIVQGVEKTQTEQGAAVSGLRAEFQAFGEDMSGRITGLEERMDTSETDRRSLHEQNDRLEQKFNKLELDIRRALDRAMTPERVAELVAMIERHEQMLGGTTEASS